MNLICFDFRVTNTDEQVFFIRLLSQAVLNRTLMGNRCQKPLMLGMKPKATPLSPLVAVSTPISTQTIQEYKPVFRPGLLLILRKRSTELRVEGGYRAPARLLDH